MTDDGFDQYRQLVAADPERLDRLLALPAPEVAGAVIGDAADLGFTVTTGRLDDEVRAARRRWFERWV